MKVKIILVTLIIALISGYYGCASVPEEHKGAATGAAIGAATGAVAGVLIADNNAKGAIIGGLVGALVGGAIGHYAYDQKRTREETAQKYDYQASSGSMVRIEDVSVEPNSVPPGGEVKLGVTYALLDADPNININVTEIRGITYQGELVGKPEAKVSRTGGTYYSTVPLYLPKDAKRGSYKVITTIQTANAQDSKETTFQVK